MRKLLFILLLSSSAFGQWSGVKPMLGRQVNWAHPASKGLVGFWLFNEGSGNTVFDLSGKGNTGTFTGTAPSWSAGKFGSSVLLPGTDEYIDAGDFSGLMPNDTFSVSIWVKQIGQAPNSTMIGQVTPSSDGWMLYQHGNSPIEFFVYNYTVDKASGSAPLTLKKWTHLVGVSTSTYTYLYKNGVLDGSAAKGAGSYAVPGGTLKMGKYGGNANYLNGQIDLPMVWNRALSASEIALLYREPFCMFEQDNIALMAVEAPAPGGGQVIMITSLPILFIGLYLCRKYKEAA